ncbi:MAG TPA: 4-vinyl reductase [Thermoanaerobaculia bacterium]|nr:4-vinyl reductase [Thermoanaerobaculia bacterium]HUM30218.1 4-vinyl reductase [Thermoanaerobaculia bacterium]HXK68333.1 4-vinyl reductase [Thermoanaerobaculia bacterium]
MGKIKGVGYKVEQQFVRDRYGEEVLQKILTTMTEEDRKALAGIILVSNWYPQGPLERFRQAVAAHFEDRNLAVIEEMGKFSAQYALTGIYRVFLAIVSPAYVIKKVGHLYQKYFDNGKAYAIEHGPKDMRVVIEDWEDSSPTLCAMMKGYFEKALELAGARNVTISKISCVHRGDPKCEFRGTWE